MSLFGGGHKSAAQTPTRAMGIDLQGAQYGAPIPVVFGRNKLAGNVIWYGDFQAIAHTQKQGGKGGGGGQSSTSYTYACSYQVGLFEGVGAIVNVYDGSSVTTLSKVGGLAFNGGQGQAAWAHLAGSAALGYSGTVLVAFQNKDLGSSASLPNYNFEVDGRNQFSATVKDANPADIVTAICTDSQIGVHFNALGDLTAFKNYCTAAGLFFSPVYSTQSPAQQALDDLIKYANSAAFFSEGQLKVVPYGDATITGNGVTYTPNLTAVANLTRDDFITNGSSDPVTVKRIAPADAMNIQRVEFKDRANTYHTGTVVASIDQDVVGTGARADHSDSVDMITDSGVARLVSQNLLQRTYYVRNTYEFQLSWRYCYLEPMDIVTLTDANTGLYQTVVRITEVSEDEHGLLSIVAEEFPQGVSHASTYATQPNAGATVDPNADPGAVDGPYLFRGPGFLVSNSQPEIWCALAGDNPLWAGCDVYLSHDGTSYTYLATHSRRAAYGVLSNALPSVADPDTTSAPNVLLNGAVQLLGGTQADADQFITLAMVDNEILAYQTATLASGPSYTLGYLRRGGYGSAVAAHAAGAPFVRLDEAILRIPVDPSQIGQTVYLKFVSFNVFGKGGRTLADETAYTYVIGTNVELPDVPVTPASPAVTGVADGNSISWSNPNPAAVGCTSIEYASASGGPWTVLAQVGPTTTAYVHHFTTGATYYYRLRSRGPVVAAGWSAYTAVISGTGTNVGAISSTANSAQSSANTATGQVAQLPVINGGFDMVPTGYGWTADSGSGWAIDTAGNTPGVGPNSAKHVGGSGNGAYRNGGLAACNPGQVYKTQGLIKAVGANGSCYLMISWCNSTGAEISTTPGNQITGNATAGSFAVGVAPAGTVYARTCIATAGHTAGTYYVDNVLCSQYPSNIGEVPDGGGRYAVNQVDGNGLAIIDLSQAGHVNKTQDYISDGVTYGRLKSASLTGNDFDFAKGGVNKNLGNVPDGGGRYGVNQVDSNGLAIIDFSKAAHVNKNLGNVADGGGRFAAIEAGADNSKNNVPVTILNPNFEAGATGWNNSSTGDSGTFLITTAGSFKWDGTYSCVRNGNASLGTDVLRNNAVVGVTQGEVVGATAMTRANATNGTANVRVTWLDASNANISSSEGNAITGTTGWVISRIVAPAPANAVKARIELVVRNHTDPGGSYYFDGCMMFKVANSQDEVPDGTTYARIKGTELSSGQHKLGVAGSGYRLGDLRNQVMVGVGNYASGWSGGGITYSATSTSATISMAAASLVVGSQSLAYNASSVTVSGTAGTTVTYYLYIDDPGYAGGSRTLSATTSPITQLSGDGRLNAGSVSVTFPTSGTGGGGGGQGCPQVDEPVIRRTPDGSKEVIRAGDVHVGDLLLLSSGRWGRVSYSEAKLQPGVRVTGADGSTITCSASAPLETAEGPCVPAPYVAGLMLKHRRAGVMRVADVADVGAIWVQHITCEDDCFWVGDWSHHNLKPMPNT